MLPNVGRGQTHVRALNCVQGPGVAGRNVVTNGRNSFPTMSGRENVAPQARQFNQTMSGPSSEIPRTKGNELQRQHVGMKQTAPSSVRPVQFNHLKQEVPNSHFNKSTTCSIPIKTETMPLKVAL